MISPQLSLPLPFWHNSRPKVRTALCSALTLDVIVCTPRRIAVLFLLTIPIWQWEALTKTPFSVRPLQLPVGITTYIYCFSSHMRGIGVMRISSASDSDLLHAVALHAKLKTC